MDNHHLTMGQLADFITGETLPDTHDERYRQKLARLLVEERGYARHQIEPRRPLLLQAGEQQGRIFVDLVVRLSGRAAMIVQYGPGSLVSRHRPALGISRLIEPYQVPVVVVTNGENADVLDGFTGKSRGSGLKAIPSREELEQIVRDADLAPIASRRVEVESRIVFAFEIDCSCSPESKMCPSGFGRR